MNSLKKTKLWKSMFRHDFQDTPRTRLQRVFGNVFLHLHPVKIPVDALKFTYTWGLGGISFVLFFVLIVTGVLLMFYYRPTTGLAFRDMKDLEYAVTLGTFLRNMHRWGAHAMVMTAILHMVRVFLTGAYKPPREFNWVIGVILLTLTFLMSYTGYLLPWDQLALWAVTVGANMAANTPVLGNEGPFSIVTPLNDVKFVMLGGTSVGEAALLRFYVMHCIAIPFIAALFMAVHFWRVRKDVFSRQTGEKVDVWPHLVSRELLATILTLLVLSIWSLAMNAPLEEMANPTVTPNPSKAPWYFVGLQELLVYFDPWIAGVLMPTIIVIGLMAIPYVDVNPKGVGRYAFTERKFAWSIFLFGTALWFALIFIGTYCRGPNWEWYNPGQTWSIRRISKLTLMNIPNFWGLILLGAYFLQGMVISPQWKQRCAVRLGEGPTRLACQGLDFGLGALMGAALMIPLIWTPEFFRTLGQSRNAPLMQSLFALRSHLGAAGELAMVGIVTVTALCFGLGAVGFGRFKDRLWGRLGLVKYAVVIGLLLLMASVPAKILLRLLFGVKYIVSFPTVSFNI
ncbi:MAG: cytochrome bc complex cytochrome b subunit [Candidatus Omnitrophica bacterium]|nr:cytochrome bc complex cytochrome b subunit [Candidatus Omnitrophota bacterium]